MTKFSGSVHIKFPIEMLQEIDKRAAEKNMTRSTYVRYIIDLYFKSNQK